MDFFIHHIYLKEREKRHSCKEREKRSETLCVYYLADSTDVIVSVLRCGIPPYSFQVISQTKEIEARMHNKVIEI